MIAVRNSSERGHTKTDWLDSRHTFSFADYYDPHFVQFRQLRVINEDLIAPGRGFPTHGHRDMEIISYIAAGALEHRDSLGNGSVIRPGEIQRMSAGTGIMHSEFNPSRGESTHLLQIWIMPAQQGLTPGYEQHPFAREAARNRMLTIARPRGGDGAVVVHQDVELAVALLDPGHRVSHPLRHGYGWLQVVVGTVAVNGIELSGGDGAAISAEQALTLEAKQPAEILLFDLA
jgi:redox-sensitive bicupin YhaK (pirin superfamily)